MSNLSMSTTLFAGIQWLFFIFANTIVVPISIGEAFQLAPEQIAMMVRSSFITTGIVCILQGSIGHRYALLEGHSGLWWGFILSLCASASSLGMTYGEVGGGLALGILLAGAATALIGAFNLFPFLQKLFTPMVITIYLLLLSIQLIIIFFKGMLKLTEEGQLNLPISLFSVAIVILVIVISIKGKGLVSNFSILIGIVIGWIAYSSLFPVAAPVNSEDIEFSLFPWGKPQLQIGIVSTVFLAGILNASNTFASIDAAENLYRTKTTRNQYRFSFILTGMFTCLAAVLGLVPYAPFASSIGFLESTRIINRKPFIIGGAMFAALGIIPVLGAMFSALPITVGSAVLFVAYLQLFGTALRRIQEQAFNSKTIYRLALPALTGVCLINAPASMFADLPVYIRPLFSNGLLMGVLISIILEQTVKWSNYDE